MNGLHLDVLGTERIRRDTYGLAELAAGNMNAPVPTCGDWNMADLVAHLLEVQHFWTYIVGERPAGPERYEQPVRPDDAGLVDGLRAASDELLRVLDAADPADVAWSWAEDQSVGFTLRRQTHEALVHHIDGCLAVGSELPETPARLGADGVDEILGVMLSTAPDTDGLTVHPETIELSTTDSGDQWQFAFGKVVPADGGVPLATLVPTTAPDPNVRVSASALELDLWIWGRRSDEAVVVDGDVAQVSRLRELVSSLG
jgi:uncharacterized protein (TIGR03083 family)